MINVLVTLVPFYRICQLFSVLIESRMPPSPSLPRLSSVLRLTNHPGVLDGCPYQLLLPRPGATSS